MALSSSKDLLVQTACGNINNELINFTKLQAKTDILNADNYN
jgi:hypothetical protein